MKHKLLIALMACCSFAVAQPIFQKQFVGISSLSGVIVSDDGNLVLSATDRLSGAGNMSIIKTDRKGSIIWARSFGDGATRDTAIKTIKALDGGYLTVGYYNVGQPKIYLVKSNANGTKQWSKFYEVIAANNTNQSVRDITQLPDSSIVMVGTTLSTGYGFFLKVDKMGNVLFAKNPQANAYTFPIYKVIQMPGGDFLVAGAGLSTQNLALARLDATGTQVWCKQYNSVGISINANGIRTADGNYVFMSHTGIGSLSLIKIDPNGNPLWHKTYSGIGTLYGFSLKEVPNGDLISTFWCSGYGGLIMKTNSTGNFISCYYNATYPNVGCDMITRAPDGSNITTFGTHLVKFTDNMNACQYTSVVITATAQTPVATNLTMSYNGYGQTITRPDYTYSYPLNVATVCGGKCTTTDNMSMAMNLPDTVCQGDQIAIANASSGSTSTTWYENGVQFFAGASPPPRTYNTPGTYTIMLTGFNGSCKDTTIRTFYVKSGCGTNGTAVNVFQKSYTNFTNGADIQVTSDKGYVVAGSSPFSGNADMCMLKLDSAGGVQWGKYFGSNSVVEYGTQVRQTMDGGYIIAGYNNTSPRYMFVVKTDAAGNVIWENNYQMLNATNNYQSPVDILLTVDSGFVILGNSSTINYALMFKIDKTGTVVWGNNFNGSGNQSATVNSICHSYSGGGFMITGTVASTYYVASLNMFGTVIWAKTYPGLALNSGQKIMKTIDGNFLVGGYRTTTNGVFLMKMDINGNIIWTRTYYGLGTMTMNGMKEDKDRGFVLTGNTTGSGNFVIKTDRIGLVKDAKYYFGTSAFGDYNTYDGGYIIVDNTNNVRKFTAFNQINGCSINQTTPSVLAVGPITPTTANFVPNAYAMTNNQFYLTNSSSHAQSNVCANNGCNTDATMLLPTIGCAGTTYNLLNTSVGGTTYTWKENNVTFSNSFNATRMFSAAGTYSIKLVVTGLNGCADSVTQNIVISNPVTANAGNNITIACGNSTMLQGSGGTTYTWAPLTGLTNAYIANPTATPSTSTTYTLTAATGGCSSTAAVTVTIVGTPTVTATGGASICVGQSANLSCSGNATTYTWMPGGTTGTALTVSPTVTTTYTVMGYTSGNCYGSAQVTVIVNPLPTVSITQIGNYLQSTAAVTYQWYLNGGLLSGAVNQTYTFTQNGNYTVVVTDANGCTNTSAIFVVTTTGIESQPGAAVLNIVPNPNNGMFTIYVQTEGAEDARITLHNMLGEEVELIGQEFINGLYKKDVDVQHLRTGVYFMSYRSANGTITRKFIKN